MNFSEPPSPPSASSDAWPGLARLAADATQVLRLVGTIIGSGDDTRYDTAVLRECLQDELGDLRAAIDYVISKNALDWDAVNRRRDRTRSRYERWAGGHREEVGPVLGPAGAGLEQKSDLRPWVHPLRPG